MNTKITYPERKKRIVRLCDMPFVSLGVMIKGEYKGHLFKCNKRGETSPISFISGGDKGDFSSYDSTKGWTTDLVELIEKGAKVEFTLE